MLFFPPSFENFWKILLICVWYFHTYSDHCKVPNIKGCVKFKGVRNTFFTFVNSVFSPNAEHSTLACLTHGSTCSCSL
jgi:hypothetical protein